MAIFTTRHTDEFPPCVRAWQQTEFDPQPFQIGAVSTVFGISYTAIDCNGKHRSDFSNPEKALQWIAQQYELSTLTLAA